MSIQPIHHLKQRGFTLVEVIVVAVIVAILAGVSVPLYLGYINSSRTNQATNAAGSAASFINACRNGGDSVVVGNASSTTALPSTGDIPGGDTLSCAGNGAMIALPSDITLNIVSAISLRAFHSSGGDSSAAFSYSP